jgi:hypothetical protein
MDVLGFFLWLILFAVLVMLAMRAVLYVRSMHVVMKHESRPVWPWSITTYNGWNESIPAPPASRAFFPRPWVM